MNANYRNTFAALKAKGESAFIPFAVAGDPDFETSLRVVRAFVDGGADILEIGMPFSDPIADGPVNQAAGQRALKAGMTPARLFDWIRAVREFTQIPIGLLCYSNTILRYGPARFFTRAAKSGLDSVLIADAPIEESAWFVSEAERCGIDTVFLVSELSGPQRIRRIVKVSTGFLYLVARLGVTGPRRDLSTGLKAFIRRVQQAATRPVCVGFGISTPEQVRAVSRFGADGVICGSAIVRRIEQDGGRPNKLYNGIRQFVRSMKEATQ